MASTIRVLAWNLGQLYSDQHPNALPTQAVAIKARKPDIVLLNEALRTGPDSASNQVLRMAELTGYNFFRFSVTADLGLGAIRGQKLVGVLSKHQILESTEMDRVHDGLLGLNGSFRTLETVMQIDGRRFYVYSTRFTPHNEQNNITITNQLRDRVRARIQADPQACVIVGGDLNMAGIAEMHRNGDVEQSFPGHFRALLQQANLLDSINGDLRGRPIFEGRNADGIETIYADYILYRPGAYQVGLAEKGPENGWPGGGSGTDHPYIYSELQPLTAEFVRLNVPPQVTYGAEFPVEIVFRNTSSFAWSADHEISLELLGSPVWNPMRINLTDAVQPRQEARATIRLKATATGQQQIEVRLVARGIWEFGNRAPRTPVLVTAAAGNPAVCQPLAARLVEIDAALAQANDELTGNGPRDAPIKRRILTLTKERERVVQKQRDSGCL